MQTETWTPTAEDMQAAALRLARPVENRPASPVRPRPWFDWEHMAVASPTVSVFRDRLLAAVHSLPAETRAAELDGLLRELEPRSADMVISETQRLVDEGHDPPRALRAALGAVLVARRKKHWWVLTHEVIPFQAQKVAEGIYLATADPAERARRVEHLVRLLRPEEPIPFVQDEARVRLREFGMSTEEIEHALAAPRVTAHDIARQLRRELRQGLPAKEAVRRALAIAMYEYVVEHFKAQPVALGAEFCVWASALAAGLAVVGTVVGVAVPLANQAKAERRARDAETRQRNAPLMAGEIEQIINGMFQNSNPTRWGDAQKQAALDFVRVNRLGRTAFVEPELRQLREAFARVVRQRREQEQQARRARQQAQRAQQQATQQAEQKSRNTKILIGAAVGAVVLVGGALAYRAKK